MPSIPTVSGWLRQIGVSYDKLGLPDQKLEFYHAYLHRRPFGKNADRVRRQLGRDNEALAQLSISSSLPCDEMWLNRQRVPAKLLGKRGKRRRGAESGRGAEGRPASAIDGLLVAPGHYRALCVNYKYEIAYFEYAQVALGTPATLDFRWSIVVNDLKEPYGRITIENPRVPGVMMDLGISTPEVGVIVPKDGRALRVVLRDDSGSRHEDRTIVLRPGQRHVIKW